MILTRFDLWDALIRAAIGCVQRDGREPNSFGKIKCGISSGPNVNRLKITFDNDLLERLKRTTQSDLDLEVDLLLTPGRVGEPGQRPLALYVLMVCDSNNGFILGVEPLTAEKSLPEMHAAIPNALLTVVLQNRIMPKRLLVRSEVLRGLLRTLTQSLNIELRRVDQLPSIDEAAAAMMQSMFGKSLKSSISVCALESGVWLQVQSRTPKRSKSYKHLAAPRPSVLKPFVQ